MKRSAMLTVLLLALWMMAGTLAEAAANEWVWIDSDTKYGKYYAPSHVKVESAINGVPTQLSAWTKTVYTAGGAQETIANYGIEASIPDPKRLAYSTALLLVRPQTREIEYVQENFYDPNNKVIWSKVYDPRTTKEINSQSFDEDFYVAIVDSVFHYGERERQKAADRWVLLWESKSESGSMSSARADMTTMRMAGDNLIYHRSQVHEKSPQRPAGHGKNYQRARLECCRRMERHGRYAGRTLHRHPGRHGTGARISPPAGLHQRLYSLAEPLSNRFRRGKKRC